MKIKIIGDSGVGKTSLVNSLATGQYNSEYNPLITVEHGGGTVKLGVEDNAGQQRFRQVGNSEYRGMHGVVIVFDTTDLQSFNNVKQWLGDVKRYAPDAAGIVIVGTKSDLTSERAVDFNAAKEYADQLNIPYVETSAKNHTNVEDVFKAIVEEVLVKDPQLQVITPAASQPQKSAASAAPRKAQAHKTTAPAAPPKAQAPITTASAAPPTAQASKTKAPAAPPTAQASKTKAPATQSQPQLAQTRTLAQPVKPAPRPPTKATAAPPTAPATQSQPAQSKAESGRTDTAPQPTAPAALPTAMEQYVSNMRNTSRDTAVEIDENTARSLFDVGYNENLYHLALIDLGYNRSFSNRDASTLIMTLSRDKTVWNEFLGLAREHRGNVNSFLRTFIITFDRSEYPQALHNLPTSAIADLFSQAKEKFESSMKEPQQSAQPATQQQEATASQQATSPKTAASTALRTAQAINLNIAKHCIKSILSLQLAPKVGLRDAMSVKISLSKLNNELKGLLKKQPSVVKQAYLEIAIESLKEIEKAKQAPTKSIVPVTLDSGRIAQLSKSHPQIVEQAYIKVAIEWLKEIEKAKQTPTQDIAAISKYSGSVARLSESHPQILDKAMEEVHSSKPAPQQNPARK